MLQGGDPGAGNFYDVIGADSEWTVLMGDVRGKGVEAAGLTALFLLVQGRTAAGFLDGLLSMSYEKFVMDTDMCGALHSYLAGIEVNEDTLGFDALAQNGPGEHMFGTDHTLRHYETAYWDSGLNDDQTHETWFEQGSADYAIRANKRWKDILNAYEAPAMDDATDEALRDFIDRKKASMPDAWY